MSASSSDLNRSAFIVPELIVRPTGVAMRLAGRAISGVGQVADQVVPYTKWWSDQNQLAMNTPGPLWVVVGDSTSIGIGASAPEFGYVRIVAQELLAETGRPWQVVNLALSGARVADGLDRQLPILTELSEHRSPALVTCCIGSNDVFWGTGSVWAGRSTNQGTGELRTLLAKLVSRLPEGAIVAEAAGISKRAALANRAIRLAAADRGMISINPWRMDEGRLSLAQDRFHPSDRGHEQMARAFLAAALKQLPH